jgi:type IV pilus biogenesis protein PilP
MEKFMQNKLALPFLAGSLFFSAAALAESTFEELAKLEAGTLVLKAQQKQLEVQAQIVAKRGEIASKQAENDRLIRNPSAGDPQVRSIEGIGKTVYATLELGNGSMVDVKAGDRLPNGMKVVSVRPNEVVVESGKNRLIRLASGLSAATPSNPAYQGGALGLPPLPPMMQSRSGAGK